MAIQFARARYISRSTGGNAVRSAAYNGRDAITAERTGELFYFRHRDATEHHAVLLPEGAAERFAPSSVLWNAAEAAERRRDAQVAREIVLALPANAEVSTEDRIALARDFAEAHFVAHGLAVQLDVHAPHGAEADDERGNWHAHLLITTRRIEGDRFADRKARDLDPEVRRAGGRARVTDGTLWGELWREHQERYFREHGLAARVDPLATHAQEHIGPVRMRRSGAEIVERAEIIRQANQAAARDPAQVLATLTRHTATFSERDLDRLLTKHLGQEGIDASREIAAIRAAVLAHPDLVALHERDTGAPAERFTTRQVRAEEQAILAQAARLACTPSASGGVSARGAEAALATRTLRADQAAAFAHALGTGQLKLIEGRAGTGKSYTLAAIRHAHAADGKRVIGLAPTNAVAQDLAASRFAEAGTVHAALFGLKNGRDRWDRDTVVIVDEAAMLDTRMTGELLAAVRQAGAKLVLAGDDRQLASIERGGLFAELRQRHGAAEISEVTRQSVDWQRQAARDLAEGRFVEAVGAFERAGAITWTQDQEDARTALVAAWTRDTAAAPSATRFVFAYTNRDVDALNADLRQVRRDRGELGGPDVTLATKHGAARFAVGDRVQFTETDKTRHIANGNAGTITGLDARTGQVTVVLDAAGGARRSVTWSAGAFQGFRHGYAGTIYKGQGKTLDHTYLYHTAHWRAAASYVALTRQRDSAQVFVARETARDARQLAWQMGRDEMRAASVAWATREEAARQTGRAQASERPRERPREGHRPAPERDQAPERAREAARHPGVAPPGRPPSRAAAANDASNAHAREAERRHRQPGIVRPASPDRPPHEAPRRDPRALDRSALTAAAAADRVWQPQLQSARAMTVQDAARRLDPVYAAAADHTAELRSEAASVEESIARREQMLQSDRAAGEARWREMGFLQQLLHKTGLHLDPALTVSESGEDRDLERLGELYARRDELAQRIPQAETAQAAAFARAEPAAEADLAQRQEHAELAREVLAERQREDLIRAQQEREREEREEERDLDDDLDRDLEIDW